MSKPKSLITGACGFMGTHMVEVLAEAGHDIRATDLPSAYAEDDRKTGRFPSVLKKLGVEFVPADLARPETLQPLVEDVDYIFHVASVFSYKAPWSVLKRVNVDGTRALLDYALKAGNGLKRVVVWGAGGIYGLPDPEDLPFREDSTPAPTNDYLRSKWFEEHMVMKYGQERGLKWSIMRPTTVYGPRAVYGGGQLLMGAAKMPVAAMPSSFTGHIPFVHVRDVCRAALHLAESKAAENQAFNLNDDTIMTTVEFFKYVAGLTGHRFVELPALPIMKVRAAILGIMDLVTAFTEIANLPPAVERGPIEFLGKDFAYANDKLKSTGYKFLYPDARDGIRDTIAWYKQEGWL
ncbi:MAG TPA: NAD(P)-dependent oxidoreductase [Polyangia bacterium]|jgi:UDP-glucose 4-epimerase